MFGACTACIHAEHGRDITDITLHGLDAGTAQPQVVSCCGCAVLEYEAEPDFVEPIPSVPQGLGDSRTAKTEPPRRPSERSSRTHRSAQPDFDNQMPAAALSTNNRSHQAPASLERNATEKVDVPQRLPTDSKESEQPIDPFIPLGCCDLCPGRKPDSEYEVLQNTWWVWYAVCCGGGFHEKLGSVYMASHCLCFGWVCEPAQASGADVDGDGHNDGMFGCVHTMCCCSSLMQWPPRAGAPYCMVCSQSLGMVPEKKAPRRRPEAIYDPEQPAAVSISKKDDVASASVTSPQFNFWDFVLYEQWVPLYMLCAGCACHDTFMDVSRTFMKCYGWTCRCGVDLPKGDDGFCDKGCCSHLCSCYRMRGHVHVPPKEPRDGNPILACWGKRLRKVKTNVKDAVEVPPQLKMAQ
mmetsp:Transcript_110982/g.312892  ORF Transcript_110982/g.312892 Transcript_110982/m.312892 type:complete len:409 (+) Transcript_110982:87-1313(+)